MNNRATGALGEDAAEQYLRTQGYRILERNYLCKAGEIDIIAEHKGCIAFVEVKARAVDTLLPPAEAVDDDKQNRIRKAAKFYLSSFRDPSPRRFDVVSVWLDEEKKVVQLELAPDAFRE